MTSWYPRRLLEVRPKYSPIVQGVHFGEPMSVHTFVQRFSQVVGVEDLAILNRRSEGAVLSVGTRINAVVGRPTGYRDIGFRVVEDDGSSHPRSCPSEYHTLGFRYEM